MRSRTLLVVGAVLVAGFCAAAWAQFMELKDAPVLLEKGLHEEETAGDLDKAIGTYEQIIQAAEAERGQVAEARYRLCMCYLKKGEKEKAREAFQKLVTLYPDQTKLLEAAAAKEELVKVVRPVTTPPSFPTAASSGSLSAARLQLADVEAELVARQAEYETGQMVLERAQNLFKAGTMNESGFLHAKADLSTARAQLKAAQEKKKILTEEVARLRRPPEAVSAGRAPVGTQFLHGAKPLVGEIPAEMRGPLSLKVNLSFDQTPMPGVVEFLEQVTGVQFVLFNQDLAGVGNLVTLKCQVSLEQGLNLVCELADLAWAVDGNVIKIGARERFEPLPTVGPAGLFGGPGFLGPAGGGGLGGFGDGARGGTVPAGADGKK